MIDLRRTELAAGVTAGSDADSAAAAASAPGAPTPANPGVNAGAWPSFPSGGAVSVRFERAIIRRDPTDPRRQEGDRVQMEIDPEKVQQALDAATRLVSELNRLLGKPPPRRRRRRR